VASGKEWGGEGGRGKPPLAVSELKAQYVER